MLSADLFVYLNGQWVRIEYQDVILIESVRKHCIIHTSRYKYRQDVSITRLSELMDPEHYCRVHRRFVIPFSRIRHITSELVNLGDREVPIGRSFYKEFLLRLPLLK